MKFLFKYTFHLAILACVSALFSGCEQDPKYRVYDYPVPVVESIYPYRSEERRVGKECRL